MRNLVVVEDDPDVQALIQAVFEQDPRFRVGGVVASADDALWMARDFEPSIIVLDHRLAGEMTGIEVAPQLKEVAPKAKIILFTAHADLRAAAAEAEFAIDAFVLKTEPARLLAVAQLMDSYSQMPG